MFTAIANIESISGPSLEREEIDVTAHDSPQQWREYIGGLKDGGEITFDINYDPTVHDVLVADLDVTEPINYEVAFPTSPETVWTVGALLTGFEPDAPHDDKLAASLTLKVSGPPTLS